MDILNLKGRVAFVTGAGQGVGRQVAIHLAAYGAAGIVVNDYFANRAESVAEEIRAAGGKAIAAQADVTSLEEVRIAMRGGEAHFGPIDILVNNAGNFGVTQSADTFTPFWECGPEEWRRWVDVNFYGVANCCSAVIPSMIERRYGRIVTVTSDAGRTGEPEIIYSGAKAGAAGLMRGMARTLGRYMITANSVSIASTATPTTEEILDAAGPERRKKILEKYVIRRQGQPADVANMVLFLSSDASSWITGQTYPVNGGFSFGL